jgi:hypothetical protein
MTKPVELSSGDNKMEQPSYTMIEMEFDPPIRIDSVEKYVFLMECMQEVSLEYIWEHPENTVFATYRVDK